MSFSAPVWLWCTGVIALVLLFGWRQHDRRQQAALRRFVAPQLVEQLTGSLSRGRRRLQRGLFLLALLALCAALAGPLLGYQWQVVNRRGEQIIFALDTSRSMLTADLKPSRLLRAKLAIDDLARELDGNALGIVAFAGTAFLACPLTFDVGAFRESLGAIDTHSIPRGGTNVASAIGAAQAALNRRADTTRILILVTDGEDLEGDALAAAQAAARQGIKIYTIGVGSAAGELISLPAEDGGGFVKDESGAFVRSRLDENALKGIAAAADGMYVALGPQGGDVDAALKSALQALAKQELASRQQRIYTQRFQWPLAVALGSLCLSLLVGARRRQRGSALGAVTAAASAVLLALAPLRPACAADTTGGAAPPKAPDEPIRSFNHGTEEYRAGRYKQAGDAFEHSIRQAPSDAARRLADQQDAYYNLGNSLYRAGQATEKSAKEDTLKAWNAAVKAYDTALQLRPDDSDSRFNRDFVKKKIDQLNKDPPPPGGGGGGGGGGGNGNDPPPPPGGQPPPGQQAPGQPPPGMGGAPPEKPQPAAPSEPPGSPDGPPGGGAGERVPGQMSAEEARQLLDSAKGDEKHPLNAPGADLDGYQPPPDKPYRNW